MTKETRIAMLENRIMLLEARQKDNKNIVKAIKRTIKLLRAN